MCCCLRLSLFDKGCGVGERRPRCKFGMPVAELGEGEYAMLSEGRIWLAESRTQVGALVSGVNDQVEDAGGWEWIPYQFADVLPAAF